MDADEVLSAMRQRVDGAKEVLRKELGKLRTGRAQAGEGPAARKA